jgi:hypothetical protein
LRFELIGEFLFFFVHISWPNSQWPCRGKRGVFFPWMGRLEGPT